MRRYIIQEKRCSGANVIYSISCLPHSKINILFKEGVSELGYAEVAEREKVVSVEHC
jgi:hypothetical protein